MYHLLTKVTPYADLYGTQLSQGYTADAVENSGNIEIR